MLVVERNLSPSSDLRKRPKNAGISVVVPSTKVQRQQLGSGLTSEAERNSTGSITLAGYGQAHEPQNDFSCKVSASVCEGYRKGSLRSIACRKPTARLPRESAELLPPSLPDGFSPSICAL